MNINFQEVRETIKERKQDIEHNSWATNGLILDDLMMALGYNKKRDRSIKSYFKGHIKWEMKSDSGHKLIISVLGYLDDFTNEFIDATIKESSEYNADVLMITDGATIKLFMLKNDAQNICSINIENEINESDSKILAAITKSGFSIRFLESLIKITETTEKDVERIFCDNIESLSGLLIALVKTKMPDSENAEEQTKLFLNNLKEKMENPDAETLNFKNAADKYIARIEELSTRNAAQLEELEKNKKYIAELEDKLDRTSGASKERAQELMEILNSQSSDERSYIAIVNEQIVQFKTLHEFVGKILQLLYEIKSFEAETYIFNGSIFRIRSENVKYNDMVINGKSYDIMISNEDEDEAFTKLRTLMSRFDDIAFDCKKTGHLEIKHDTGIDDSIFESDEDEIIDYANNNDESDISYNNEESTDENVDNEEEIADNNSEEDDSNYDNEEDTNAISDNNTSMINDENNGSDEDIIDGFDVDDDTDENVDNTDDSNLTLLVAQILNVDKLVYSEEKIDFYNIKYIGSNSVTYLVNDGDDISYEQLLCKCIDAIMAIQEYEGDNQTVIKLKQKNLSTVNNYIKAFSSEYRNYPRINGTKYTVVGVETIEQIAMILSDICNELKINTEEMFIYFEAQTSSEFILENYGYEEAAVQLRETDMYTPDENPHISTAILKGDMYNNIIVTKNSLRAHADVINKTLAVKTRYTARVLSDPSDYVLIVESILNEAAKNHIDINTDMIGYVAGETYKLVSENIDEVSENNREIHIDNTIYYCSVVDDWQIPASLIRIHTAIFSNTSIAIKTLINADAVNYYASEYETTEPSTSLAIKSYTDYVASCVR